MDSSSFFWAIWEAFNKAGPLANFLQIFTAVSTSTLAVWALFRFKLKSARGREEDLKQDVSYRDNQLRLERNRSGELEACVDELNARIAASALQIARREWRDGNDASAHHALRSWLEREGADISQILLSEAEWLTSRAVGSYRAGALSVAEALLSAAFIIDPNNLQAKLLLNDVQGFLEFEAARLDLGNALTISEQVPKAFMFKAGIVESALDTLKEAQHFYNRGHWHVALSLCRRAGNELARHLGGDAVPTLEAKLFLAAILRGVGEYDAALKTTSAVITSVAGNPKLGAKHRLALIAKYQRAHTLFHSSSFDEALALIEEVIPLQETNPDVGPNHPEVIHSRHLYADLLGTMGRTSEALDVIKVVAESWSELPSFGPAHPNTRAARHTQSEMLLALHEPDMALKIINGIIEEHIGSNGNLDHPNILTTRHARAQALLQLARYEEALEEINEVINRKTASKSVGPKHASTLSARHTRAELLFHLDRREEALKEVQDLLGETTTLLGAGHVQTRHALALWATIAAASSPGGGDLPAPNLQAANTARAPASIPNEEDGKTMDRH